MPEETQFTGSERNAIDVEFSKMNDAVDRARSSELRIEIAKMDITDEKVNNYIDGMQNALDDVANGAAECLDGIREFAENGEATVRTSNGIDVSIARDDDGKFTVTFDNAPDSDMEPRTLISTDDVGEALEVFESGFVSMEDMEATLSGSFADVHIGHSTEFTGDDRAAIREEAGRVAEIVDISSAFSSRIQIGSETMPDTADKIKLHGMADMLGGIAHGALALRAGLEEFAETGEAVTNTQDGTEVSISRDENGMYTVEIDHGMGPETVIETTNINEALSEYENCFVDEDDVDAIQAGVYSFVDPDTIEGSLEAYENTQETGIAVKKTVTVGGETFTSTGESGDLKELADAFESPDVNFDDLFDKFAISDEEGVEAGGTDISENDDVPGVDTDDGTGRVDDDGSDPVD